MNLHYKMMKFSNLYFCIIALIIGVWILLINLFSIKTKKTYFKLD